VRAAPRADRWAQGFGCTAALRDQREVRIRRPRRRASADLRRRRPPRILSSLLNLSHVFCAPVPQNARILHFYTRRPPREPTATPQIHRRRQRAAAAGCEAREAVARHCRSRARCRTARTQLAHTTRARSPYGPTDAARTGLAAAGGGLAALAAARTRALACAHAHAAARASGAAENVADATVAVAVAVAVAIVALAVAISAVAVACARAGAHAHTSEVSLCSVQGRGGFERVCAHLCRCASSETARR